MQFFVALTEELACKSIAKKIEELIKKKPNATIALPTGSTPKGLYRELAKKYSEGKIDFSKTRFMNLDEYIGLGQDHKQSYAKFLRKNFFDKTNAKEKNIFLFNGKTKKPEKEAEKRETIVRKKGIDLALLGIGENAHIAFNEPGSSFSSRTRIVKLSASTITANSRFFKNKKEVPKKAISMGLATITKAKKIILLAFGKKKAGALKKTENAKPTKKTPSTILQKHKDTEIYCDAEAAELLEKTKPIEYGNVKIFFEKNLPKKKRVVFVSPHPDDSAIACGATLSLLSKNNKIFVFVMTTGYRATQNKKTKLQKIALREKENKEESLVLKTKPFFFRLGFYENSEKNFAADKKKLQKKMQRIKPDIVFLPQEKDNHPTHSLSRKITLEALSKANKNPEIWEYETPWTLFPYKKFNSIVEFTEKTLKQKINAIRKHSSQIKRTKFDIAAKSLSRFRAIVVAEQILSEFGEKPPKTNNFVELLNIKKTK